MATQPSLRAQFPSGPLIDETGEITPVWRAYFSQLYIRTGGAAGASSDTTQLQADLDAEEAARQAADLVLTTGLVAERTAREAADSAEAAARAQADAQMLPKAGGTMTGNIILPAATPTLPRQAVSKSYVDGAVGGTAYAPIDSPPFTGNPTAPTPAPGDNDTSLATTAFVAAAVAPAQGNVGRNLIHNSMFNVAQRGAGLFTATGYTLDRWQAIITTDIASVVRNVLPDSVRAQIGDEAAIYYLGNTFTGNAAAGAFNYIRQTLESVRRTAGKTVTISLWAACGAGALKLGISCDQYFGVGGSPSTTVQGIGATSVTLSTTWTRYSVSMALPSVSGKTLGTGGNDQLDLNLWFSSGATNNAVAGNIGVQSGAISLWGVQLEIGSVATSLEKPDPQVDLANCQRFYLDSISAWYGTGTGGQSMGGFVPFKTTMRGVPTITFYSTGYGNASGVGAYAIDPNGFICNAVATTNGAASLFTGYKASADL